MPNIRHPEHITSQIYHVSNTVYPKHPIPQALHIPKSYIPSNLHANHPTTFDGLKKIVRGFQ